MARVDLKERFEGLCEAPNPKLHILDSEMLYREGRPLSLDFIEEQQAVDDALGHLEDKGCHVQVIIFDNLSTLRRSVSENDNDAAKQLIDWFAQLTCDVGVASIKFLMTFGHRDLRTGAS